MAIDLEHEHTRTFADMAQSLPGRPNISTLHRWRLRGIHGVKLETVLIGGRRFTSLEAMQRFADATTAAQAGEPVATIATSAQRTRAIARAEAELSAAGI
ncbi:MAG: DUF1580 domain-containing protein [Pirellulales bacterium]